MCFKVLRFFGLWEAIVWLGISEKAELWYLGRISARLDGSGRDGIVIGKRTRANAGRCQNMGGFFFFLHYHAACRTSLTRD